MIGICSDGDIYNSYNGVYELTGDFKTFEKGMNFWWH